MGGGSNPVQSGPCPPPPGGGCTSGGSLSGVIGWLSQIYAVLAGVFSKAGSSFTIDTITCNGTTQLYGTSHPCKKAIIQNISTSGDNLTLVGNTGSIGRQASGASGSGIILNGPTTSGQAGGSLPVGNIDLSGITVYGGSSTDAVSVYQEF